MSHYFTVPYLSIKSIKLWVSYTVKPVDVDNVDTAQSTLWSQSSTLADKKNQVGSKMSILYGQESIIVYY